MRTGECCLFVKIRDPSFPGHAPGKDTLRAANAATERGQTGENARANVVSRRALSPVLPKEGANGGENARASVLRSEGVCSSVKKPRTRRRKRGLRGENNRTSFLRSKVVVFPSYTKDIVFSRTCAGKRHPESRERGDRKGVNGGKREGERSEQESVVTRQNKDSRRDGGHAPPQRHLERSAATTKTRFTGRKQNKQSEFCCLPVIISLIQRTP